MVRIGFTELKSCDFNESKNTILKIMEEHILRPACVNKPCVLMYFFQKGNK